MAFKQSWSHVKRASEPTTFQGKYGLKRAAGLEKEGSECYVIPLDMASGYSCLPYHSLKKNDNEGFHGSTFNSVKIACRAYNPETGEKLKETPLCCKLAQMEKDRLPEADDSAKRALSFSNFRYVFPVLVLSTTETDASKKTTLKKLSIKNGVTFSFVDLAQSSYEEEMQVKVIEALQEAGEIDDPSEVDAGDLMKMVAERVSHSIIKISNVKSKSSNIPYQKSFRVISNKNELIGQANGETKLIQALCKLLAGEYKPEELEVLYKKAPILKEINNQVIDFLQLYEDNVDSLTEPWTEEELKTYYNEYVARQNKIEEYKAVNEKAAEAAMEEEDELEVGIISSLDEVENDNSLDSIDVDDEDDLSIDMDELEEEEPKAVKKPAKVKASVGAPTEENFDLGDIDAESSSSTDSIEVIEDEDLNFGEEDFEDLI